jgi:enoyl-CoA hydratase
MTISLEWIENHIGLIKINRPEVRNALSWQMMDQFSAAVTEVQRRASSRVVVVTGSKDAFCSGGDLKELIHYQSMPDSQRLMQVMTAALDRLAALPCPTIAGINGMARGGGAEIALACDLRVMAGNADFGMVHSRMGLTPGWGGGQRLLRLVGYSRALELMATGRILSPAETLSYGLVNRLAPAGKALEQSLELAYEIAAQPFEVVQAIKRLLTAGIESPAQEALKVERAEFLATRSADEHQQLVEAFLKRKAAD